MPEYTYECELCKKQFTFDTPKGTPYFYMHDCLENYPELDFEHSVDLGGALYRIWKPHTLIVRE